MTDRCPTCQQPLPQPTEAHVVDGVLVEPVTVCRGCAHPRPCGCGRLNFGAPATSFTAWRAAGRYDLPLATFPAQAAQLAKIKPATSEA